jgi:hypothetical protein
MDPTGAPATEVQDLLAELGDETDTEIIQPTNKSSSNTHH